jgi:hypothetical protein
MKATKVATAVSACALSIWLSPSVHGANKGLDEADRAKSPTSTSHGKANPMKIQIAVQGKIVTATLNDSPTAKDFLSLLPMTTTLEDYMATEKITYLPRKLAKDGAPPGTAAFAGDISYYAPWGNLAIFHKDFPYSVGLIKLGSIDTGIDALKVPGSIRVTIEPLEK